MRVALLWSFSAAMNISLAEAVVESHSSSNDVLRAVSAERWKGGVRVRVS